MGAGEGGRWTTKLSSTTAGESSRRKGGRRARDVNYHFLGAGGSYPIACVRPASSHAPTPAARLLFSLGGQEEARETCPLDRRTMDSKNLNVRLLSVVLIIVFGKNSGIIRDRDISR